MNTHGGARAGAGRKSSPRNAIAICWRISPATKEWILETAEQACITPGEVVDELVSIVRGKEV